MPYIVINSANRSSGTDGDFLLNLPFSTSKFTKLRLKSAQLYNSFYNVTDNSVSGTPRNNVLSFQISPNPDGSFPISYSISIPQGYYSITSILPALQSAINTAIAPLTSTVTIDQLTKNLTITLSNPALYLNVLPLLENQGLNLILGFSRRQETGFTLGGVVAPRLPNLNRYSVLYLETNFVRNSSISSGSGTPSSNQNLPMFFPVTSTIQVTAGFGELISFLDTTSVFLDIANPIGSIRCTLRDSFGYAINTNGLQILYEFEVY